MNITTTLATLALKHPQRLAIIDKNGETTYDQLNQQVINVAQHLLNSGITKGDVVLLYVNISRELYGLLLGLNRIGAVVLFIDPTYGPKELKHCITLTKPKAMIVDDKLQFLARLLAPLFGIKKVIALSNFENAYSSENNTSIAEVDASHPALITFTSGSSGLPKGIVRSHGFLERQCQILSDELDIGQSLSEITTLPIFVLANLACGVTSILPVKANIKLVAQQVLQYLPERILAAPAFLLQLATYLKSENIKCHFVRQVLTGGGPVFPQLLILLRQVFPEAKLVTVYGSTEAEPIAHLDVSSSNAEIMSKIAAGAGLPQGKVSPHVDLAILPGDLSGLYTEAQFDLLRAEAHVIGEIVVAGEHVVNGYISAIGDNENKIKVGSRIFHRTGDAGYIDNEGNLFLVGRAAMKVDLPGSALYPLAVEASVMATGLVESCAFLEVNKKRILVAKLSAAAEDNSAAKLHDLLQFASIDQIVIRSSLPMDKRHNSKILYKKLKKSL